MPPATAGSQSWRKVPCGALSSWRRGLRARQPLGESAAGTSRMKELQAVRPRHVRHQAGTVKSAPAGVMRGWPGSNATASGSYAHFQPHRFAGDLLHGGDLRDHRCGFLAHRFAGVVGQFDRARAAGAADAGQHGSQARSASVSTAES